jgi:hypothetical protein
MDDRLLMRTERKQKLVELLAFAVLISSHPFIANLDLAIGRLDFVILILYGWQSFKLLVK